MESIDPNEYMVTIEIIYISNAVLIRGKSLIYIKNNSGPRIEPWGTPLFINVANALNPLCSIQRLL